MKARRVGGKAHSLNGMTCRHCKRVCKKGQVVLDQLMPSNPVTDNHFVVHVKCMAGLVRNAPVDTDEIHIQEVRERILATGDPYTE